MRSKLFIVLLVSCIFGFYSFPISAGDVNEIYAERVIDVLEQKVEDISTNPQKQEKMWLQFLMMVDGFVQSKQQKDEYIHPALLFVQQKIQDKFLRFSKDSEIFSENELHIKSMVDEVLRLVNIERQALGLSPLQYNSLLIKTAEKHALYIANTQHFSHNEDTGDGKCLSEDALYKEASSKVLSSQDSTLWSERLNSVCIVLIERYDSVGYNWQMAGENIAMGQTTAQKVVTDWMNSPEHKKNILHPGFTEIGIAYIPEKNIWVQDFGTQFE